eukprot:1153954-Pelagomonas_calceolata.AAC.1
MVGSHFKELGAGASFFHVAGPVFFLRLPCFSQSELCSGWDAGNTTRLAQHNQQVPEQISNRAVPSYLFKPMVPIRTRRNSSRPDAIL